MRADLWTDERVEMLRKLWAAGLTAQAIADRLGGVSRSAVMGKVFRLRLDAASATSAAAMPDKAALPDSQAQLAGAARSAACEAVPVALPPSLARRRRSGKSGRSSRSDPPARSRGKSLFDLTNTSCRWPLGRPGTPSFFFCGAPEADLEQGMPYCARHARRAYLTDEAGIETADATATLAGELRAMLSAAPTRALVWRSFVRRPAARWR